MRELFVYYRVRPEAGPAAHRAVAAMQRDLCDGHPGLEARLLKRREVATSSETWMEIYAFRGARIGSLDGAGADIGPAAVLDDVFESRLATAALALVPFIDGSRHVERFEAVDPP